MSIPERRKTIAFARFREAQREKAPLVIDMGDQEVEIPSEMPATVMLDLMAWMEDAGDDADLTTMPANLALQLLGQMIGDQRLRELVRDYEMTMTEFYWLLNQIFAQYSGDVEQTDSLGKRESVSTSSSNGTS